MDKICLRFTILSRILLSLTLLSMSILPISINALEITAASAILMDLQSNQILYAHHAHTRRPPASTTKVMTAILALELGQLSERVTVSKEAAATGGSSIYLEEGEVLTLEEMLWGLLLNSGNDAAVAIAEHIGGSVERFAKMMNMKAFSLGAVNTTFKNPHGLPQEGHLSTAYDLALMTRYALEKDLFSQMVGTREYRIPWPGQEWERSLHNSNKLLSTYPHADGVKTGWTIAAGRCLISSASRGQRRLISVTLNSPEMYRDSITLLEHGFRDYTTVKMVEKGETFTGIEVPGFTTHGVALYAGSTLYHTFPREASYTIGRSIQWREGLSFPLVKGQPVAWLYLTKDGEFLIRTPLLLNEEVNPPFWWRLWQRLRGVFSFR